MHLRRVGGGREGGGRAGGGRRAVWDHRHTSLALSCMEDAVGAALASQGCLVSCAKRRAPEPSFDGRETGSLRAKRPARLGEVATSLHTLYLEPQQQLAQLQASPPEERAITVWRPAPWHAAREAEKKSREGAESRWSGGEGVEGRRRDEGHSLSKPPFCLVHPPKPLTPRLTANHAALIVWQGPGVRAQRATGAADKGDEDVMEQATMSEEGAEDMAVD